VLGRGRRIVTVAAPPRLGSPPGPLLRGDPSKKRNPQGENPSVVGTNGRGWRRPTDPGSSWQHEIGRVEHIDVRFQSRTTVTTEPQFLIGGRNPCHRIRHSPFRPPETQAREACQGARRRQAAARRVRARPPVSARGVSGRAPEPKGLSVLVARGAVCYALASSFSANCRAAQARTSTTEQPPTSQSFACRPGEPQAREACQGARRNRKAPRL
jgi:hypothetical protein